MAKMDTIADLRKVLAELEEERDVLAKNIESVRNTVNLLESRNAVTSTPAQQAQTLRDSVYQILSEQHPLHRRTIFDRLIERGIPVGGVDPVNTVGAHLSKDERFKNVGRGQWDLVERNNVLDVDNKLERVTRLERSHLNLPPDHVLVRPLPRIEVENGAGENRMKRRLAPRRERLE